MKTVEFRVRPVTRYIVTRYHHEHDESTNLGAGGSEVIGEFLNSAQANAIATAMTRAEAGSTVQEHKDGEVPM